MVCQTSLTNMYSTMVFLQRRWHVFLKPCPRRSAKQVINKFSAFALTRSSPCRILGIETSCDDTGAAVVDDSGNVLGEALNSQTAIHVE